MILLLDTNVILDALLEREGFAEAAKSLLAQGRQEHLELISASAATDIFYTVEKSLRKGSREDNGKDSNKREQSSKQAQEMLSSILVVVSIVAVDEEIIKSAIDLSWKDYEDAVQYCVAKANGVDFIVTRNKGDFELDDIPVVSPAEMLQILQPSPEPEVEPNGEALDETKNAEKFV